MLGNCACNAFLWASSFAFSHSTLDNQMSVSAMIDTSYLSNFFFVSSNSSTALLSCDMILSASAATLQIVMSHRNEFLKFWNSKWLFLLLFDSFGLILCFHCFLQFFYGIPVKPLQCCQLTQNTATLQFQPNQDIMTFGSNWREIYIYHHWTISLHFGDPSLDYLTPPIFII